MTLSFPLTATNNPFPYVMAFHDPVIDAACPVQLIPSGLVMTRFPTPSFATATNNPPP